MDTDNVAQVSENKEVLAALEVNESASAIAEAVAVQKLDYVKDKYRAKDRTEEQAAFEQAKAYSELEKRLGGFTGAPEQYDIKLPDELVDAGFEFDMEDPLMKGAFKLGKRQNMSNDALNEVMTLYAKTKMAEDAAQQQFLESQIKNMGHEGKQRIANLEAWAGKNLPPELVEGFLDAGVNINAIRAIEKLVSMTMAQPINPSNAAPGGGVTETEVKAMQFAKDEFGGRKINSDLAFRAEYERKAALLYGTHDYINVVG
jgi:hypothetical protein